MGAKARKHYVFTAYGRTDLGYVIRYGTVFEHNNARSLALFLRQLPPARTYFSDGAPMCGKVLGSKVLQEKSATTNLVESFNAQLRQCMTGRRRKTKAYAQSEPTACAASSLWASSGINGWCLPKSATFW